MFQEQFAAFYNENELPDGYSIATLDSLCSIKGGKRLPADGELLDTPTAHPYIRVRDLGSNRYVCLTNQFQYIDEETHSAISRYIVNTNDIVISIVGTIGLIGKYILRSTMQTLLKTALNWLIFIRLPLIISTILFAIKNK